MFKEFIKRLFDIIFSSIFIIILFPFLIPIIIILRLTGEGEVFYLQKRIGYKNKVFYIYKFATMVKNSPNIGSRSLTLRNDPRVLPFGKFLRKTKINELPQLFNVFIGDMSIVGPRPQMEVDFLVYPENVKNSIYNTKPGLTGLGSIFFRDEEFFLSKQTNPRDFYASKIAPYKGELELWYLNNRTFIVDLILILLTILAIIFPNKNLLHSIFKSLPKSKFEFS